VRLVALEHAQQVTRTKPMSDTPIQPMTTTPPSSEFVEFVGLCITLAAGAPPRCKVCDDDCREVTNHASCYAYQPERGWCPFLHRDN
jgi:hypothetical protein